MTEPNELTLDQKLRATALDYTLRYTKGATNPDSIVAAAQKFYDFLSGSSKETQSNGDA